MSTWRDWWVQYTAGLAVALTVGLGGALFLVLPSLLHGLLSPGGVARGVFYGVGGTLILLAVVMAASYYRWKRRQVEPAEPRWPPTEKQREL